TIHAVTPLSPATRVTKEDGSTMGLQENDVIKAICSWAPAKDDAAAHPETRTQMLFFKTKAWIELKSSLEWPHVFSMLQQQDLKKLDLRVERSFPDEKRSETYEVTIEAEEDKT